MRLRTYITIFLTLFAMALQAQSVRFTASASQNQVALGQVFEVTFSVNANAESFTPPDFGSLQIVGGPNSSTSMSSINGNTTISVGYSYELTAIKPGTVSIGAASVVVNGKRYTSNPITIKVTKDVAPRSGQQQSVQGNQPRTMNDLDRATGDINKSIFIRAVLSKPSVYQGQQLTVTYRLYTQVQILGNQQDKMPDLNGFWNEEVMDKVNNVQWRTEIYNGRMYNVADIKQNILFPEKAGDIRIDPMVMTFAVAQRVPARNMMEELFGDNVRQVRHQAKSNAVTVHVKPLPEAGKPEGFGGAVGNFTVDASIDKKELKANEPLNIKVKIKGTGNLKLLNAPVLNLPPDFEKYDPKLVDSTVVNERGVSGYLSYNYLVIPRREGNYTVDPLKFSYFNPATGKYISASTPAFKVKVNKGDRQAGLTYSQEQQDIKQLGKDIRYIKTDDIDLYGNDKLFGSGLYYALLLLGPLAFGGAWFYRNWSAQYNADVVKVKNRRAGKVAAKHLANAKKQLAANNMQPFYEAVARGLYGYLSDKLNIPAADLNTENITAGLQAREVKPEVVQQLTDTLDLCAISRYAPVTVPPNEVFEKAKAIINEIEAEI